MNILLFANCARATRSYNDAGLNVIYEEIAHDTTKFSPIRITFDTKFFDGDAVDGMTCTSASDQTYWKSKSYQCKQEDVNTPEKVTVLKDTLVNVQKFLQETIKVNPVKDSFQLSKWETFLADNIEDTTAKNTDLYVHVTMRGFGYQTPIAQSAFIKADKTSKRPVQAALFVNPRAIPAAAQKHDDHDSNFFWSLVHEMIHVLGVTSTNFENYHAKGSTKLAGKNAICTMKSHGLQRSYLVTPWAHQMAKKHFNLDKFKGDENAECRSGIELEDSKNKEYAGAHPEGRVYLSEVMTGHEISLVGAFRRFTDVSAAMLLDTGNYEIDFKHVKPIVWGNGEAFPDKNPLSEFATGIPYESFPQSYIANTSETVEDTCGFDFKHFGLPTTTNANNLYYKDKTYQAGIRTFYNPKFNSYIGSDETYDYIPYRAAAGVCKKNQACVPGKTFRNELIEKDMIVTQGACFDYKLEENQITFTYEDNTNSKKTFVCKAEDKGKKFDIRQYTFDGYYYCPDLDLFKTTIALYDSTFEGKNPIPEPTGDDFYDKIVVEEESKPSTGAGEEGKKDEDVGKKEELPPKPSGPEDKGDKKEEEKEAGEKDAGEQGGEQKDQEKGAGDKEQEKGQDQDKPKEEQPKDDG